MKGGTSWHLETWTFSIYHLDFPAGAVGKLNEEDMDFEYDKEVLNKLNIKEEEAQATLS